MKKIRMMLLITTLFGVSGTASAVDSVLTEEQISYKAVIAALDDELCTAIGEAAAGRIEPNEDREGHACISDVGFDVTLSNIVRQRVESMIDRAIATDSQQTDNPNQ